MQICFLSDVSRNRAVDDGEDSCLYYFVGEGRVKGFREISGRKLGFTGASGVLENGQINAVSAMKHKEKPGSEFLQNPGSSTLTSGSGGRI